MIVTEDNVSKALSYLAHDPHPLAEARFKLTMAENKTRETYSELFLSSNQTTVDAKKASVECHPEYKRVLEAEAEAIFDVERHKSRSGAAATLIEVWRTENANVRAAERVR